MHGEFATETIQVDPRHRDEDLRAAISQKPLPRPTHSHTRTSSNLQNFSSQIIPTEQTAVAKPKPIESLPEKTADEMFKEVKRRLEGEQEYKETRSRKSNCFYTNLKKKLELEIRKIEDKKQIDKTKFLIEGCHMQKHRRDSTDKRAMTDRPRPQTALTRTGLELKLASNDNRTKRPQSCRSRTLERKEIEYMK